MLTANTATSDATCARGAAATDVVMEADAFCLRRELDGGRTRGRLLTLFLVNDGRRSVR